MSIKIALLGAGRMGTFHAANAAADSRLDLAFVVDTDPARASKLACSVGAEPATLAAVLANPAVRGVLVASSTDAHLYDTIQCLHAGKAVFCEKPLDLDSSRLQRAADALSRPGLPPLFVAFNRRFDPHFRVLKARLDAGEIGALETLHIVNHDPAPPALAFIPGSGGLFRDFTIHDFDMIRWLTGDEAVELFAFASCLIDPAIGEAGDVDTAKLIVRTTRDRLCTISNSRRSGYGYDQRIELFGSKGALSVPNLRRSTLSSSYQGGDIADAIPGGFQERYIAAYRAELGHFADLIEGLAEPQTGYEDSLKALAMADAAARSAQTGGIVRLANGVC